LKSNPLVSKRFQELADKAAGITVAKIHSFTARDTGNQYYNIDSADFGGWATSVLNLLQRVFGEDSIHFQHFSRDTAEISDREYLYRGVVAILDAAREDCDGGYLFSLPSLIKAEIFDDVLEQASSLLSAGYKDPACVVAGVAL
jgi:hypothetical protein